MKKALGLILLIAFVAVAANTSFTGPLKLKRGALTNRVRIPLVGTSNACTTQFVGWSSTPSPALGFNLYCKVEADTWSVDVLFKWTLWPRNSGPYDSRQDTVITGCTVNGPTDTLRSAAKCWGEEFYPRVSQGGYFIFAATESLTDTLWVDSVVFNGSSN